MSFSSISQYNFSKTRVPVQLTILFLSLSWDLVLSDIVEILPAELVVQFWNNCTVAYVTAKNITLYARPHGLLSW